MPPCLAPTLTLLIAAAQAGGGGSFGGGGGGGGGFSGGSYGGDGGGAVLYVLLRLILEYPLVGIPVAVVLITVAIKAQGSGRRRLTDRSIGRHRALRQRMDSKSVAQRLQAWDPGFVEARFLERVRVAFNKTQEAWCAQELEGITPFVSDGVFERFSLQIEEQRREGWRQRMRDTTLRQLRLTHAALDGDFETITVGVAFGAKIDRLSLGEGEPLRGSLLPRETFEECWTFLRRRGVPSRNGSGLIEGHCPNCGAEMDLNRAARCGSCEAYVKSGAFDWVLVEITQASVWFARNPNEVANRSSLSDSDPDFSAQLLEDRASVAFWRVRAAEALADVAPLARIATSDFIEDFTARFAAYGDSTRVYTGDAAVGHVTTLGVLIGGEEERAIVEVLWDGRRARANGQGEVRLEDQRQMRRTLLEFVRPAGSRTEPKRGLSTASCGVCGAHDAGGTQALCPYCGAPRTGGKQTWMLRESCTASSPEARSWLEELRSADGVATARLEESIPSPAGLLVWAVALVSADGDRSDRDLLALQELSQRLGLDDVVLQHALSANLEAAPEPPSRTAGRSWLRALAKLALEDGRLSGVETFFLRDAARQLGTSRRELDGLLAELRGELRDATRRARKDLAREPRSGD